jgi:tRNA pseudouridine32 synthase / 23S rRNA pseudouridine746 synthase
MSRAPKPTHLPTRQGVSPSCVALPFGTWPTILAFLCERLPAVPPHEWQQRMLEGEVLWENGQPINPQTPYPHTHSPHTPYGANARVFYYRKIDKEPELPFKASIIFQDEHLLVADKPHFMPVTPSGQYVQQSLLVQLKNITGIDTLSPIHRIDRETAGLVMFSVRPQDRNAYQTLFRERLIHKTYHAIAPWRETLQQPLTHRSFMQRDEAFFKSIEIPQATPNSETHIQMLTRVKSQNGVDLALYQLHPVTGQRHQLRVHMNSLGAPIVGDQFYPNVLKSAQQAEDFKNPLQLLAFQVSFVDPITLVQRLFESKLQLQLS